MIPREEKISYNASKPILYSIFSFFNQCNTNLCTIDSGQNPPHLLHPKRAEHPLF